MPTHTFIADNAQAAVEQIRAELGPEAVVLSVRKLPRSGFSRLMKKEQIEVVASLDPAPSRVPAPAAPLNELHNEVLSLKQQFAALRLAQSVPLANRQVKTSALAALLIETGILPEFCEKLLAGVAPAQDLSSAAQIERLKTVLRTAWRDEPVLPGAAVHLFVGVPGSGKSTVLCKMLAQVGLVEQQPATVYQLDSHVTNPAGQTAIFAEIIGAQYERSLPPTFERREESVFVDLPGVAIGDEKGLDCLRPIIAAFGLPEIHLVLNGAYEASHLLRQVAFFSKLGISDLIVSHLDEETRWGKLWNLLLGTNFKLRLLSQGQNVPGALVVPSPEMLFARQFCEL